MLPSLQPADKVVRNLHRLHRDLCSADTEGAILVIAEYARLGVPFEPAARLPDDILPGPQAQRYLKRARRLAIPEVRYWHEYQGDQGVSMSWGLPRQLHGEISTWLEYVHFPAHASAIAATMTPAHHDTLMARGFLDPEQRRLARQRQAAERRQTGWVAGQQSFIERRNQVPPGYFTIGEEVLRGLLAAYARAGCTPPPLRLPTAQANCTAFAEHVFHHFGVEPPESVWVHETSGEWVRVGQWPDHWRPVCRDWLIQEFLPTHGERLLRILDPAQADAVLAVFTEAGGCDTIQHRKPWSLRLLGTAA